jgi:glutaminyl-peptide cyclotransferase
MFTACGGEPKPVTSTAPAAAAPKERLQVPVPRFDQDSAYSYVAAQVDFGPRVMNTPAHEATKDYLVAKLESFGAQVEQQKFTAAAYDGTALEGTNIIARFNPEHKDKLLLAAHWDTRHVADSELEKDPNAVVHGADDGASGVGVLLEIARQVGLSTPDIGVEIVFFDAEDYGGSGDSESWGLGSQHYAKNLTGIRPRYGILLDMVGAKDATFAYEGLSKREAPQVVEKVWNMAHTLKYGPFFPKTDGSPGITDDHFFVMKYARIPMIDIINFRSNTKTGFVTHWHTGDDNMDKIDAKTLQAVGQTVTAVLYREGAGTI